MEIEYLEWDSLFFKLNVGRIINTESEVDSAQLNVLLVSAKKQNYDLIYFFSDQHSSINGDILNKYGGRLVDKKVVFGGKTTNQKNDSIESIGREYDLLELNPELLELAYISGQYSRYRIDPKFGDAAFKKLYKIWMENSVKKIIADKVFVVEIDGKIEGMVTLKIKDNFGEIGLIAVNPSSQGRGIGSELINVLTKYLKKENVTDLKVATQLNNESACSFYRKCNLLEESINNIYHFWL